MNEIIALLKMAHEDLDPSINGIDEAQELILEAIQKLEKHTWEVVL
jgi:hypothetical protein